MYEKPEILMPKQSRQVEKKLGGSEEEDSHFGSPLGFWDSFRCFLTAQSTMEQVPLQQFDGLES
jgi:hypothetical protein